MKHSNCATSWNAWDILTALFPVLHVFWQSNKASAVEKYRFRTPGNGISETLNSKLSLIASALKNLCLWCEFQSCLPIIISLPLKNILTALILVKDLFKNITTYFRDWPVVDRVCPILPSSNLQMQKSHLKKIWTINTLDLLYQIYISGSYSLWFKHFFIPLVALFVSFWCNNCRLLI